MNIHSKIISIYKIKDLHTKKVLLKIWNRDHYGINFIPSKAHDFGLYRLILAHDLVSDLALLSR
jgi:hypothetical protein